MEPVTRVGEDAASLTAVARSAVLDGLQQPIHPRPTVWVRARKKDYPKFGYCTKQGSHRPWKVMNLEFSIFRTWKVLNLDIDA